METDMKYIADRDGERHPEMYCPEWPRLLADVGGTNARFALEARPGQFEHVSVYPCSEFPGICDAIQAYLRNVDAAHVRHAAVAIANPVDGDLVAMTNHDWRFSIDETRRSLGFETLCVVNDFTALAMALPYLDETQLRQTGGESARPGGIVGLLGAGTGLGVSGLVPTGNSWIPLAAEGGHTTFAPVDERDIDILRYAWTKWPHVSFERLASGPGIEVIYQALTAQVDGNVHSLPTSEIVRRALDQDSLCVDVLERFCAILGTVAGNLALTLGASGGIYIGGGVVPRLGPLFDDSPFRERFEAKGRFAGYLRGIPTFVITAEYPAFLGVAAILENELQGSSCSAPP
jgi:glucokinase